MFKKDVELLNSKVFQLLDEKGNLVGKDPKIDDETLLKMYETMVLGRVTDTKTLQYQRQGRILTYAPNIGQEACSIGAVSALEQRDWMIPSFREMPAWLYRGVTLKGNFMYWIGSELGSKHPEDVRLLPVAVPIGSQFNHAVGIAMASAYKGNDEVSLAFIGDGGTSEGEFHEALNYAAVFKAPVIFFIQNNQFAISVRIKDQTRSKTLAQKGIAYDIPSIRVDGNDILAVHEVTKTAVERCRKGEGPFLIEGITYRIGPHTTSDDPTIYRSDDEVEVWRKKDPLIRFKKYMIEKKLLTEERDKQLYEDYENKVNEAFQEVEKYEETPLEDIFKYTYEKMTPNLESQYDEYVDYLKRRK